MGSGPIVKQVRVPKCPDCCVEVGAWVQQQRRPGAGFECTKGRTGSWVPGILVARLEDMKRTLCCKDATSNYSWGLQDSFCCNLRMQWSKE